MPDHVPAEFVGLARALRRRIDRAQPAREAAEERLLAPFRPRPGFQPMPRHALLKRLAAAWRGLPTPGRLMLAAGFDRKPPKLLIAEVYAQPAHLVMPGWEDDFEPALHIVLRSVIITPPAVAERTVPLAVVGLHALARRYQRGAGRTDKGVLVDLCPLGRAWPGAVTCAEDEISIPAATTGLWRGAVMMIGPGMPVVCVRTFIGTP